ncbi:Lon protease family protein [Halanaerobacter jeridensis]|uniref:endopeptidase La n=1 Tax=Halanaerobacter jeridensis TaxID=706427 RepID=A0A938XRG7_9FIRM|nr:AAA family ATPase [Halanaerobacter jeridensis]MBM7556394.1 lon-related putative ATP-dependent protease [Halanaerobacter jeridensis]
MPKIENNNLSLTELNCNCGSEVFDFETTEDLEPLSQQLIGQDRAVKAMDIGLQVDQEGYNIFMSGITGTGRTTYAKRLAQDKSEEEPPPQDICYVYNFSESEKPRVLMLPAGVGSELKADMEELIEELKEEIPQSFSGEEYEEQKNQIMNSYQKKSNKLMEEFRKKAREEGFELENTPQGLMPVALNENNEPINQEEFQELDEEEKEELREKSQQMQNELDQVMRKIRNLKDEAYQELNDLEKKIAFSVIQPIIAGMEEKYSDCQQVIDYLEAVKEDITENLDQFKEMSQQNNGSQKKNPLMMMGQQKQDDNFFHRYEINLFVNNEDADGAPVVYESNPTYYNLFGKIEGKTQFGMISTDFTMIKKGAIHKANGGYLILKAKDVLSKFRAWESLKRVLINQEAVVENIGEEYQRIPITTLKPEAIDLNVKVIMIGSPLLYQLLYHYDEEFKKLFKIKADFDVEMDRTSTNMKKFASFISHISRKEDLKHFTVDAVTKVIEYSSRLTGDRNKLSTRFNELLELIYEANARSEDSQYVQFDDVLTAIEEKEYRDNLAEEKVQEMIEKEHILIDTEGEKVGQINGLAVYQTGQYSFGRPTKITARTFVGQSGLVNIEREVDMSGKIHNKGVMILSGFLGGKYAQDKPLSLSASLTFEQNYGGVDGDSASCAELLSLLSSLSKIDINQQLAITGSLNQKGEVQPIGGVNQKIEGFYKTCQQKGLTGDQGVVIPYQNVDNLMLKQEVLDAVDNGDFNIYAIKEIDEAIEIMMDEAADKVHQKVREKLEEFADKAEQAGNAEEDE